MKKVAFLILVAVIIYLIIQYRGDSNTETPTPDTVCAGMTISEALEIAEASCGMEGALTENTFCNDGTETRWIDLIPNESKAGCNPACVVDVNTKATEVNRRCTGLLSE